MIRAKGNPLGNPLGIPLGIDTGAFRSGMLTARVFEGDQRRILQAQADECGQVAMFCCDRAQLRSQWAASSGAGFT